jgi:tetratricopeptide (TPR) repeat protein
MKPHDAQYVVKRLAAVEGYLELSMPIQALELLDRLEPISEGPFDAIAELFRGEALQAVERFGEAIPAFNKAAALFPEPFNQRALLGLSHCYREQGQLDLADQAEAAATPPDLPPGTKFHLAIVPIFQVEEHSTRRRERPPVQG